MRLPALHCILALLAAGTAGTADVAVPGAGTPAPLPARLSETALYRDIATRTVADGLQPFTPQYPLWSDGARKRRWLSLPPGSAIDAVDPDAWQFPPGTRLWKEFAYGREIETRYIERLVDGSWRYASYVWNADGSDALLAPERGIRVALEDAPTGHYTVPSRDDCRACHEGARVPVLGVGALQLSPDRDALAPHAEPQRAGDADLRALVERGWLVNLPPALIETPPRIAAGAPLTRAVLGYLHGNCAHCHHDGSTGVPVPLTLAQRVAAPQDSAKAALQALLDVAPRYRPPGALPQARLVLPGDAAASLLPLRMASRNPYTQMPPLGTEVPDGDALALIQRWIDDTTLFPEDPQP